LGSADFNGDGRIDLGPIATGGLPGINALFGNGDGTFRNAQLEGIGTRNTPIVVDLNGDTIDDLVSITDNSSLRVQVGHGDGTYQETQTIVLPSQLPPGTGSNSAQGLTTIAAGDLNGDGKLDLVATGYDEELVDSGLSTRQDHYVNLLLGKGDGTFDQSAAYYVTSTVYNEGIAPAYIYIMGVRDFDGDRKPDVLTASPDGLCLFTGKGDGTLQTPPRDFSGTWKTSDVNADCKLDQVDLVYIPVWSGDSVDHTFREAQVDLGNGDGSFAPPLISDLGLGYHDRIATQIGFADFDGDRLPELVTVEFDPFGAAPFYYVCVGHNDGIWTPPPPSLSIGDATVTEGNTGTRAATFTVSLSAASTAPVTVAFATANGTAIAGSDYQAASSKLTFAPGETSKTVSVLVNGDRVPESNETFSVNLSNPANAIIAVGQGVGTIVDDEPRVSISDVTKAEGKKGNTTISAFTVTLSAPYDQPVTVSFQTVNGTATTGDNDYIAKSGTLTFAPGETTKTITIDVKGDSKREANETFYLDLFGNSSNSLFTKKRGTGTILNDD
jgi:hypothetical protein